MINYIKSISLLHLENSDIPFDKVVDLIHVNRDLSNTPIFQIALNIFNRGIIDTIKKKLINFKMYEVSKFDLTFSIVEYDK